MIYTVLCTLLGSFEKNLRMRVVCDNPSWAMESRTPLCVALEDAKIKEARKKGNEWRH